MKPLKQLSMVATQGGADAFVSVEMPTGLSSFPKQAYRIHWVDFVLPNMAQAAAFQDMIVALSRRQKAAMPFITDPDLIHQVVRRKNFLTSGSDVNDGNVSREFSHVEAGETLVVEDPLYLLLDSTGTGVANTTYCRIHFEIVNITELDRLTLLTNSLD